MAKVLRVVDWDEHFESTESRRVRRLKWVRMPNHHDGGGYTELLDDPDGLAHFGAWVLILQVASKMPVRGTLRDDAGRILRSYGLARRTRANKEMIQVAIDRLIGIGWLQEIDDGKEDIESCWIDPAHDQDACRIDPGRMLDQTLLEKTRTDQSRGEGGVVTDDRGTARDGDARAPHRAPPLDQIDIVEYQRQMIERRPEPPPDRERRANVADLRLMFPAIWLNETDSTREDWQALLDLVGIDIVSEALGALLTDDRRSVGVRMCHEWINRHYEPANEPEGHLGDDDG